MVVKAGKRVHASRARRQQILDAALDLFLEKGVGATTVDDLLARSDASVGSFYHQFASKADVAAVLYLETLELYERLFLASLGEQRGARSGIEGAVRAHLRWTRQNPKLANYLAHCREPEVAALSEARAQHLNRTFYEAILEWLGRHLVSGEIRKLPKDMYFALWMGPANEFTRLWLLADERNPQRLERAEPFLAGAAWAALRVSSDE
jgi:TetR/AcrR family transcriptional regulator, repressor of fatR-cypB operon